MFCVCAGDGWYGGRDGRKEEERSRHGEGGGDSEGHQRRVASTSSNAWSKGKPSSLGGAQKPIILKRKVEEEAPVSRTIIIIIRKDVQRGGGASCDQLRWWAS